MDKDQVIAILRKCLEPHGCNMCPLVESEDCNVELNTRVIELLEKLP
jgi:predicted ATP-grasp superfamily ATP-dependent carboligase